MTVYFDNAATTMVCPEAAQAALDAMTHCYGNPSSGYGLGREAAKSLDAARESVAKALGADTGEIYFTSGGTEGDNWALRGAAAHMKHRGRHIITGAAEHDAVRNTMRDLEASGWEVTYLNPDKSGRVRTEQVIEALRDDTVLVSLMLVNNETGAVNPVEDIFHEVRRRGSEALLHTDAVQAFLKIPFTPKKVGADMVTVSSHKIHGPKGSGALYIRNGLKINGLITGGGQEKGLRPGTEAMPAIMGFGAAAQTGMEHMKENVSIMENIKNYVLKGLRENLHSVVVNGESGAPHILNISLPGYRSEVLMNWLDAAGICVAKSSACRKGARSHVLESMRLDRAVIDGAVRLSFSRYNTYEEADFFINTLCDAASRLRTQKR